MRLAGLLIFVLGCGILLLAARRAYLRPPLMEQTEVHNGIRVSVEPFPATLTGSGRVYTAEIHWTHPAIAIAATPLPPGGEPLRLRTADHMLRREGFLVLLNGVRYTPAAPWSSWPGRSVSPVEAIVADGRFAGMEGLSHVLGWRADGSFAVVARGFESEPASIADIVLGVGVQGLALQGGELNMAGIDPHFAARRIPRTFLGVDPERAIAWFIVCADCDETSLVRLARERGALIGGQLDSASSSHLLFGSGLRGLRPGSGFRGHRPLAHAIGVIAREPAGLDGPVE